MDDTATIEEAASAEQDDPSSAKAACPSAPRMVASRAIRSPCHCWIYSASSLHQGRSPIRFEKLAERGLEITQSGQRISARNMRIIGDWLIAQRR
jgi:hypothetical protein